jgi:hypothetical protein
MRNLLPKRIRYSIAFVCLLASTSVEAAGVVVLADLDLIANEIRPYEVTLVCTEAAARSEMSKSCEQLRALGILLRFESLNNPKATKVLSRPNYPLMEYLGEVMSTRQSKSVLPADICGRQIIVPSAVDQFGGQWIMTPYMFPIPGTHDYSHHWTVAPKFSGYSVDSGKITVLLTGEDVQTARYPALSKAKKLIQEIQWPWSN